VVEELPQLWGLVLVLVTFAFVLTRSIHLMMKISHLLEQLVVRNH
jgi:hypothetical protein